jgi:hypothetical protein
MGSNLGLDYEYKAVNLVKGEQFSPGENHSFVFSVDFSSGVVKVPTTILSYSKFFMGSNSELKSSV